MGIKSFSRARAIHVMLVYTGGCNGCDIEIVNSILSPRFDAEQYKVFLTWNPREADVLVVTGPVTHLNRKPLEKIYDAICACVFAQALFLGPGSYTGSEQTSCGYIRRQYGRNDSTADRAAEK